MSRILFVAKLGASLAILWLVLRRVDLSSVVSYSRSANPWYLALALLQFTITPLLGAWRWHLAIDVLGNPAPFAHLLRYTWASMFFGQVLPASVGPDAVRTWFAWRDGIPIKKTVHSIGLEHAVMLLCLFIFVLGLQPFSPTVLDWGNFAYVPALMSAAACVGLAILMMADRLTARFGDWWIVRAIADLSADARQLLLHPRAAPTLMAISMVSHLNFAITAWWIARALGIQATLWDFIVLIPLVTLITLVPISIGGWGVREGALVVLLGGIGVPSAAALALSILFGLSSIVVSVPGAIFWWTSGYRLSAVKELDASANPAADGQAPVPEH